MENGTVAVGTRFSNSVVLDPKRGGPSILKARAHCNTFQKRVGPKHIGPA